ncbi:MAG: metallophosphoesterase [Spirochaetales bacterium]|nr:metallophosphoesterase [Spirochaetales bacterium]
MFNQKVHSKFIVFFFLCLSWGRALYGQTYDATDIVMTPGRNQSEMNFNWYTTAQTESVVQVALKIFMKCSHFPEKFSKSYYSQTAPAVSGYYHNKAVVTCLLPNSVYVYRLGDGKGNWTSSSTFSTYGCSQFEFLVVGDAQIGAGEIERDTEGWADTLEKAVSEYPETAFIMSAGDQVDIGYNENQFSAFFSPVQLRRIPVAPCLGNHDRGADNTYYHFNLPNHSTHYGVTTPGIGNYYFSYGKALFMVLNTNNRESAAHESFICETLNAHPYVEWKIVMFHDDIYGSGCHAAELSMINLRKGLVPLFDTYGIDIVFTGHDHSYSRSHVMFEDTPQLDQHYNSSGAVIDPGGTVYFTLNSSSGSKFYSVVASQPDYAAHQSQLNVPSFSHVAINRHTFTITTYRTDTMNQTDSFSIVKTSIKHTHFSCNKEIILGDVDGDDTISIIDALLVARFYVDIPLQNFNEVLADANGDGTVEIIDALLIAQYYVGLITEFPGEIGKEINDR